VPLLVLQSVPRVAQSQAVEKVPGRVLPSAA
jgi:hypothetical protein